MLEILLDTSFILPSLGIDTGNEALAGLQVIDERGDDEIQLWYSNFSVLESMWVGSRLERRGKLDADLFEIGLNSLLRSRRYMLVEEEPETFIDAFHLASMGHRDMIDNLLYSISRRHSLRFLTLDTKLRDFIRSRNLEYTLIFPDDL